MLKDEKWRKVSWRRGTKGRLNCQFAATRVHIADGHRHRMADGRVQAMPGEEEVWLIGERRATGERKYYASNLPAGTCLKTLAAAVKARWICEQAHQQLKEELWSRSFRGEVLDGSSPTRTDDDDRLRLPAIPPPQGRGTGKKESPDHPRNQPCQPSGKPSSTHSRNPHQYDALTVKSSSKNAQMKICQSSASVMGQWVSSPLSVSSRRIRSSVRGRRDGRHTMLSEGTGGPI